MKILFLTKCKPLFNFVESRLSVENLSFIFIDTFSIAYSKIILENEKIDLLISDISFQQSNNSLQNILSKNETYVPVIIYNDFYSRTFSREEKIWYWIKQNFRCFSREEILENNFGIYRKLFAELYEIFSSNTFSQILSTNFLEYQYQNKNKPAQNQENQTTASFQNLSKNKFPKHSDLKLSNEKHLSPALKKLFTHFKTNLEKEIDGKEISELLFKNKSSIPSTYTYISRLKKELSEEQEKFSIIRCDKGKYKMIEILED